jgi:glutamyl-Q tRNA(Asp) synthetase
MSIVTRFAPSPTGYLHLGHACAALTAWHLARQAGGQFLLRLEDIDHRRCLPEYATAILDDLAWLGLDWDGPVRVQSEHPDEYEAALRRLADRGLLYPCFCSRAAIRREIAAAPTAPHAPDGSAIYPGTCRALGADERAARIAGGAAFALRLDLTRALATVGRPLFFEEEGEGRITCRPEQFGDVVLGRKDAWASYHLCVTHDDAVQGVTLVTRGEDLKPATHVHRLLQDLLGFPAPRYAHHRLLRDAAGRRLAKREHAPAIRDLRSRGLGPTDVRRLAGFADPARAGRAVG